MKELRMDKYIEKKNQEQYKFSKTLIINNHIWIKKIPMNSFYARLTLRQFLENARLTKKI